MSDALTDIKRDEERAAVKGDIAELEKEFYQNPSKDLAEKLIALWKRYASVGKGYWSSSDTKLAYAKIGAYKEYIETGEFPKHVFPEPVRSPALADIYERETFYLYRAIDGHGLWMGSIDLDDILSIASERILKRADAIKLTITKSGIKIEGLTCKVCPFFRGCSLAYRYRVDGTEEEAGLCKGFNKRVYDRRNKEFKRLVTKGIAGDEK